MYGTTEIEKSLNEPFELWENKESNLYSIHVEHPEYTALCPRSGYPDNGIIIVDYIPKSFVVELKSFKLYINAFRNIGISHEAATGKIFEKIKKDADPLELRVIGDFMRRGGVKTVIEFNLNPDEYKFNDYLATIL